MNQLQKLFRSVRHSQKVLLPISCVPMSNSYKVIRNYCQQKEQNINPNTKIQPAPNQREQEEHYEESIKNKILEHALQFVPKSGWSVESLSAGAQAAGYPTITHGLFPNGGGDLIHYFNMKCNEKLIEEMKTWPAAEKPRESKVPSKFVGDAIVTRILMINPYKSTWAKAMAIQALPNNVPNSLATLLSLVDDICYHSGDRSVDFNWYLRRVGLAGIYKAAELYYLTDNSPEHSSTKSFVETRIRDAELIQMALSLNPVTAAPPALAAAFVTAKNMLGINPLK